MNDYVKRLEDEIKFLNDLLQVTSTHYKGRLELAEAELKLCRLENSLNKIDTHLENEKKILEVENQVLTPHEN